MSAENPDLSVPDDLEEYVPARTSGILLAVLERLREVPEVYRRLDGEDPHSVYVGAPVGDEADEYDAAVALGVVTGGTSRDGDAVSVTATVQVSITVSRRWLDANSSLAMSALADEVDRALTCGFEDGLVPVGEATTVGELTPDDTTRTVMPNRYTFTRTIAGSDHHDIA